MLFDYKKYLFKETEPMKEHPSDIKTFLLENGHVLILHNPHNHLLEEYPEVVSLLEKLSNYLNDDVMRELNYLVDEERQKPEDVASNFLKQNNLIA